MTTATFDAKPHGTLYPPVFYKEDMRPEVRGGLTQHIRNILGTVAPYPEEWSRLWVIGSGASYNWSESGDLDVQIWISPTKAPSIDPRVFLTDVRAALEPHRGQSLDDIGLGGAMTLQLFAKLGEGTKQENLDEKPYAAYDLDNGEWAVFPEIMSNAWYADRFEEAELEATKIAEQAEDVLSRINQCQDALQFWIDAAADDPRYEDRVQEYITKLTKAQVEAAALYDGLVHERQKAYKPGGSGLDDPRDSVFKVLEMWGVKERLYAAVTEYRATLPKTAGVLIDTTEGAGGKYHCEVCDWTGGYYELNADYDPPGPPYTLANMVTACPRCGTIRPTKTASVAPTLYRGFQMRGASLANRLRNGVQVSANEVIRSVGVGSWWANSNGLHEAIEYANIGSGGPSVVRVVLSARIPLDLNADPRDGAAGGGSDLRDPNSMIWVPPGTPIVVDEVLVTIDDWCADPDWGAELDDFRALPGGISTIAAVATDEMVELRNWGTDGVSTRTFPYDKVAAEIEFLKGTGKAKKIEVRVVGAETWHRVASR